MGNVTGRNKCLSFCFLVLGETKSELNSLTHRITQRVAGFLEHEGLLVRDDDNDDLALDGLEDDPMLQIHGYSITCRIATGKQQGRKVFTLQKEKSGTSMALTLRAR